MMIREKWRPIEEFEDAYEISNKGRIRSLDRTIMRSNGVPHTHKGGLRRLGTVDEYPSITLQVDHGARRRGTLVHILVMEHFGSPCPGSTYEIHHIDGDPSNARIDNLEWKDTYAHHLHHARVTPEMVCKIRWLYATGEWTYAELGEQFGLHKRYVGKIVRREKRNDVDCEGDG